MYPHTPPICNEETIQINASYEDSDSAVEAKVLSRPIPPAVPPCVVPARLATLYAAGPGPTLEDDTLESLEPPPAPIQSRRLEGGLVP